VSEALPGRSSVVPGNVSPGSRLPVIGTPPQPTPLPPTS
jgi:hypothetical protein